MPSWWGKSSSKEVKKKPSRESIIDTIQRKLKNASEEKCNNNSGRSRYLDDAISKKGSRSLTPSRSPSPTTHVSRCQSFAERPSSQPLPLPRSHLPAVVDATSGLILSSKLERAIGSKPSLHFPLPKPGFVSNKEEPTYAEGDIGTASVSSDSSVDSGNSFDSPHIVSPLAFDYENGKKANINSYFSVVHKNQPVTTIQSNSGTSSRPAPQLCNNKPLSTSPKGGPLHLQNLQIAHPGGGLCSAPDSSMSSPSRSPMGAFGTEKMLKSGLRTGKPYSDIASGHCSTLVSGHNSGNISVGGDLSGQMFWPQNRCSPECSPIPSPRMTSPGPSSRIQSGSVTPLHPQAGGTAAEAPTRRPDDMKQQTHQLPIRPITVTNPYPFSPTYSASTTPSAPHSPSGAENPTGPGPRWKKGQLLGRGTFGHVYLGFNRESGEMCAMKEVTLFQDDAKSRESAQQLGQEIALLSGLRHPNIVQYYGSETVDDKLYVYLEYVSGGSIYKLVREYGQLGEIAIRNYTRQILLGLAYLHAKNTVHRDIKGANILVDPSGRIKLADFGMAKHISGPSCPFSFKGSPYWMAPEVIKNSNGCNLAVDIWSLGCTVLEMATTKPPWSQYEGVAAMFKIGNSKELPTIPDHLSEDGKDFVMLCLQRDPENRPSAAQLLEHPFVKNAMLERSILTALPAEAPPAIINAVKSLGIGPAKHNLCLDSEAAGIYPLRSLRTGFGSSDVHPSRNISCPVSPTGSLLYKSSHTSGWMSPSPISSPHTVSGSSSPLTSGGGAIPFHQTKQPIFSHDVMGMIQKSRNDFYSNGNTAHPEYKHEQFGRNFQTTHACRDVVSSDNDALPNHSMRFVQGDPIEIRDGKSYLADCVSQQLLRDYVRLNACLGIMEEAPKRDRFNGL
uniref:mitogen-activated protein kinase kinase kinase n=1 Tax=Cajanus cajan TaxID=3821 RepID=A0A151TF16_CAJCA|nr:Mitogen-activated protein kinase kinase kinase 2 [Cajanus cajan]